MGYSNNVNRPPMVEAAIKFQCPHCYNWVLLSSGGLEIEHLDGNEEWNAETHLYAKCPSCRGKVEVQT